jgi:EpsI family protein
MTPRTKKAIVAVAILVLLGGFGTIMRSHRVSPDRPPDFSLIPLETDQYIGTEHRLQDATYEVLKADASTLRMYQDKQGGLYWLFVAYFSSQKYGSQIHSPKHCLPGGGFRIESIEPYRLDLGDGAVMTVNRMVISSEWRSELMLYWYETRSGVIAGEFGLKLDLMKNAVKLTPTDAAICRITMPLGSTGDLDAVTAQAVTFVRAFHPAMQAALPFKN